MFGRVLRPTGLHHGDGFLHLRPAVFEVAAEDLGFLLVPARADAEWKTPAAVGVERGDLFGEMQRMTFRHEQDAGAHFERASRGGGSHECDEWIRHLPEVIWIGAAARIARV